jgi:hypothetical protein
VLQISSCFFHALNTFVDRQFGNDKLKKAVSPVAFNSKAICFCVKIL